MKGDFSREAFEDRSAVPRVLVVEDDEDLLELCRQSLAANGYEVLAAPSAEEALQLVDGMDELHQVVTDVNLPGMDGARLSDELTDRFPQMGVLLISGYDPAAFGVDTDEVAFLAKPFTLEQLAAAAIASCPWWDENLPHRGPRGFGSFTVRRRPAVVAAAVGVAVLAASGLVFALGGGDDIELVIDDARAGEAETWDGDENTQDQTQSGDDHAQTADGDDLDQEQGRSETDSGQNAALVEGQPADPDPVPETVAYEPPTMHDPVLTSCTPAKEENAYEVTFTIEATGGNYDVLAGEPFVGNDDTVEVRGGALTWTVTTTHTRDPDDDSDPFYVSAPSVLGWAEPGGTSRQHTHQPPPLAVHVDECHSG